MPYALKTTRNTYTQAVKVHRITRAPAGALPYKHWLPGHYVESLQIFEDREAAELARTHELLAAEFSVRGPENLYEIFRKDLDRVAFYGWTMTDLCRFLGDVNRATLAAYVHVRPVNPRLAARIHIIADALENVANLARNALPAGAGCGNVLMSRGGRRKSSEPAP